MKTQQALDANPQLSEEAAAAAQIKWGQGLLKRLQSKMQGRDLPLDAANRYQGMKKSGILESSRDETVGAEVVRMIERNEVRCELSSAEELAVSDAFSFLDFTHIRAQGAELYAIERIGELTQTAITVQEDVQPIVSQRTLAFDAAVQVNPQELNAAKNVMMSL